VVTSAQRRLGALAVVLLLVAVLGAALVVRTHGDRSQAAVSEERYGEVLAAADAEATAFVNLRYDRSSSSVDAVAVGATGAFRRRYVTFRARVIRVLRRQRSTMSGHVVWSGVAEISPDRATVIAATTGTVANRRTHGQDESRSFRLRLSLVRQHGRWLTSDLQFVGAGP
jgi:Mce-associated membrane protein